METRHAEELAALKIKLASLQLSLPPLKPHAVDEVRLPQAIIEPAPAPTPAAAAQPPPFPGTSEVPERVAKLVAGLKQGPPEAAAAAKTEEASTSAPEHVVWGTRPATPPPSPGILPMPAEVPEGPLELRLGRVWLVRIGIALLLTGLVLLGNYAYQNWIRELPAIVRLGFLYFGSLLISGGGIWAGRRENLKVFGEVVLAGGLAFFYWCTFAAHHVPRLQVVESQVVAGMLLLGAGGLITGVALKRDSRVIAIMGLLLACYATVLQPLGWLSAASNLVLAMAGVALIARKHWAPAGIAAMAGIYGSFLWWQIAGASESRPLDPAALWFLPPVWLVFALPGITGIARSFSGLTDYDRRLLASANNFAFFGLFTAVWIEQQGSADYWQVPAVFGAVLIVIGALGRRKDQVAEWHIAQGLAAATLAMTLKLEGDQLAIGFGIQTLMLSLAYARFGGKVETVFASLAAVGGAIWLITGAAFGQEMPLWSRGLSAFMIAGATAPLLWGSGRHEAGSQEAQSGRAAATAVLCAGAVAILLGWVLHLQPGWRYLAVLGVSLVLSAGTIFGDRQRRLPELAVWAAVFLLAVPFFMAVDHSLPNHPSPPAAWMPVAAALLSIFAHWLWVHRAKAEDIKAWTPSMPMSLFQWTTALTVPLALHLALDPLALTLMGRMAAYGGAALLLAAVGRFALACPLLAVGGVCLLPQLVICQTLVSPMPWVTEFIPLLSAGGIAVLSALPSSRPRAPLAFVAARGFVVLAWLMAWHELGRDHWEDIMAASALVLAFVARRSLKQSPPEVWILLVAGILQFVNLLGGAPWPHVGDLPSWRGLLVPVALLAIPFIAPDPWLRRRDIRPAILLAGCAAFALWSTHALVWYAGWKPAAVLWTILGFGLVSTGLWQKLAALRHAGFALLALAVIKLFVSDVWDFATFYRVGAFLALGVALVVLGFFYNRFADVLKKLFEADET